MRPLQLRSALALSAAVALAEPACAQDLQSMQSRIEALEAMLKAQAVKIDAQAAEISALKGQLPVATAAAVPPLPLQSETAPASASGAAIREGFDPDAEHVRAQVTLPRGRPTFVSADGDFDASITAILQLDAAHYIQDPARPVSVDFRRDAVGASDRARDLNSGATFRRARIGLVGQAFRDFDYNLTFEFSGEDGARINLAWAQYNRFRPWRIRVGAFGPSDEIDGVTPKTTLMFQEPAAIVDTIRPLVGGDARFGAQLYGYGDRWFASAAVTSANVLNAGDAYDDQLGVVTRLAGRPLLWSTGFLHLGGQYSYQIKPADSGGPDATGPRHVAQFRSRPEVRVDNTRLIGTGPIAADHAFVSGLEFALVHRSLMMQGEVARFGIDRSTAGLADPRFLGWYLAGSWILTGERRGYNAFNASVDGPDVARPLGQGGLGAFEVGLRYSVVDLNFHQGLPGTPTPAEGVRGGEQRSWTGGVNWYLNDGVRLMLGLQDVRVLRLSPNPVTFNTPVGAQVGQRFQVVSVRSQLFF